MIGGFVYIMTNKNNSTFYIGVTSDIVIRVWQHKNSFYPNSFTSKYKLFKLVYYEFIESGIEDAIRREKVIKGFIRDRKINLIESSNKHYDDLYTEEFIENYRQN